MNSTSRISLWAVILLLSITAQSQSENTRQPTPATSPNLSPMSLSESVALQSPAQAPSTTTANQTNAPRAESDVVAKTEESFSQLTLFLFGSALALFIALLAWSDQIRGIDKDTKELEQRFLAKTGIDKSDFLDIVKPESPDEQLVALTQVVNAGRIETKDSAEVLRTFPDWHKQWLKLERLSGCKYNLTIALVITLFLAGLASLFTTPIHAVHLGSTSIRVEMLLLVLPMSLIGVLLGIIIWSAQLEKTLRSLLNSMSDRV